VKLITGLHELAQQAILIVIDARAWNATNLEGRNKGESVRFRACLNLEARIVRVNDRAPESAAVRSCAGRPMPFFEQP
jgi:hypothetical protein